MNGIGIVKTSPWKIDQAEYTRYSKIFQSQTTKACLNGTQARELFLQSGLPSHILFQIWNLADTQRNGQLDVNRFAIAMHLIFQKLAGYPLPLQLPPELAPESIAKQNGTIESPEETISEEEWQRVREKYRAVSGWLASSKAVQEAREAESKHLDALEAQVCDNKVVDQLSEIDEQIRSTRMEIFSVQDAQEHGYSIATQTPAAISLPNVGNDAISQKATLMLQKRIQALQMKSPSIPPDAQQRIDAFKLKLEAELGDNRTRTLDGYKLSKARFIQRASTYRERSQEIKTLTREANHWSEARNVSTSEMKQFLGSLSQPSIPQRVENITVARPNLPSRSVPSVVLPSSPKVPKKPNLPPPLPKKKPPRNIPRISPQPAPQPASEPSPPNQQDELSLIAQASRLAREKARTMERANSTKLSPNLKPKPKEVVDRGKLTAVAKQTITKDEQQRQYEQQAGPSIRDIRAAARLARLQALENIQAVDTPKSPLPVLAKPKNLPHPKMPKPKPPVASKPTFVSNDTPLPDRVIQPQEAHSEEVSQLETASNPSPLHELKADISDPENTALGLTASETVAKADSVPDHDNEAPPEESPPSDVRFTATPEPESSEESSPPIQFESTLLSSAVSLASADTSDTSPQLLNVEAPSEAPQRTTVIYEFTSDDISIIPGQIVLVVGFPPDGPGWCLGYIEGTVEEPHWIPSSYLDFSVPEEPDTQLFTLLEDFTAEVEDGTQLFSVNLLVEILDSSDPDWYMARHPETQALAYLPADILSPQTTANHTNPFSLEGSTNGATRTQGYHSDNDTSSSRNSSSNHKSSSYHHLPLGSFDFGEDMGAMNSQHRQGWASQVDPAFLASLSKEEIKRHEAVHELIATEKHYLHDMQLILDVFYLPLESQGDKEQLELLFSNLPDLIVINTMFLSQLEGASADQVGVVFLDHASAFVAYGTYCGSHAAASRYLQHPPPQLASFLAEAQKEPRCRMLSLTSFLLQPVQRITRYPLLLSQILKYTSAEHPDFERLTQAVQKAKSLLDEINSCARESEDAQQLLEHKQAIDLSSYPDFNLEGMTRQMGPRRAIMDGPLAKQKSGKQLHGFLFNDIFILTQPAPPSSPHRFVLYRTPIPLARLKVRDAQTTQGRRGIFSPYGNATPSAHGLTLL
ncbi:actin organization and endocytosis protein, variant 4 [Entomophthora muscae]|uniref:Actin organization and endocytosis protein, variant 4 n=1 Tax=Entomophthora muscae TaxID=34485 RepID=A0ACC2UD52_9FUNG|nr:actin organization and endocytosis protein, variant 4 [Entomophthora muscae]